MNNLTPNPPRGNSKIVSGSASRVFPYRDPRCPPRILYSASLHRHGPFCRALSALSVFPWSKTHASPAISARISSGEIHLTGKQGYPNGISILNSDLDLILVSWLIQRASIPVPSANRHLFDPPIPRAAHHPFRIQNSEFKREHDRKSNPRNHLNTRAHTTSPPPPIHTIP